MTTFKGNAEINAKEFLLISGALWALVALNNNPSITREEIYRVYGERLRSLE